MEYYRLLTEYHQATHIKHKAAYLAVMHPSKLVLVYLRQLHSLFILVNAVHGAVPKCYFKVRVYCGLRTALLLSPMGGKCFRRDFHFQKRADPYIFCTRWPFIFVKHPYYVWNNHSVFYLSFYTERVICLFLDLIDIPANTWQK